MVDQFIKKLIQRLGEIKIILKRNYGENPYIENRSKLISLFLDHPYYIEQVATLKKKLESNDVPTDDKQKAFLWEHNNSKKVEVLRGQVKKLISEFDFNVVYRGDMELFTYEYIICPPRSKNMPRENVPSLLIVDTDENKDINAHLISSEGRYVQIFDWTTLKDIQENWSEIRKKENEKTLEIDVGDELLKLLWQLKLSGKSVKEITAEINSDYKHLLAKIKDGILGEDNARVYIHRYEGKLKKLRAF
jgi:hypothetical protein